MSSADARDHFTEVLERAQRSGVTTVITQDGQRVAAVVPAEVPEILEELEDRGLSRMAQEAKSEGGPVVPHENVLSEFTDER